MYISISIARVKYNGCVYVIYIQQYVIYISCCKAYLVTIFSNVWFASNEFKGMVLEIHKVVGGHIGYDFENIHNDVYE